MSRLLLPIDCLVAALTDPARRERAVVGVLVGYVGLWTLYGVFAKASQDIHFDMAELVAWAREPAFGIKRVELQNLLQDYRDKLLDQKVKP